MPTEESRTLNGLVTEYLEDIPAPGTSLMLNDYLVEVLKTRGTAVELARIKRVNKEPDEHGSGAGQVAEGP